MDPLPCPRERGKINFLLNFVFDQPVLVRLVLLISNGDDDDAAAADDNEV